MRVIIGQVVSDFSVSHLALAALFVTYRILWDGLVADPRTTANARGSRLTVTLNKNCPKNIVSSCYLP